MKPRTGWTIAEGGASARRTDGVVAGFFFGLSDIHPYGAQRLYQSPRRGRVPEYLRRVSGNTPRRFSSLEKAMEAADKQWPMK